MKYLGLRGNYLKNHLDLRQNPISPRLFVYWLLLNKKGNSNTCERIALIQRFIKQFGKKHIVAVLADREFIGEAWLKVGNR
jgi:ABC-type sugar transport system substrate-binding protein